MSMPTHYLILSLLFIIIALPMQQVKAQSIVWRKGVAYACNPNSGEARIRQQDQIRDSLLANPYVRVPAKLIHDNKEYDVLEMAANAFQYAGRGTIKSVHLPNTIGTTSLSCLGSMGVVDTIVLSNAFVPTNLSTTRVLEGTYPKCLVMPSLRANLHVQVAGSIYSRDRSILYYYARQGEEDTYYLSYHTGIVDLEAFRSANLEHLVLNSKLVHSGTIQGLSGNLIELTHPEAKVYDPYQSIVSESICKRVFRNPYQLKFMLPMNHPLRRDKKAKNLKFAKESELPRESSMVLQVLGKGEVTVRTTDLANFSLADGETLRMPFSTVAELKLEPEEGYRTIGLIFRGDTIPVRSNGTVPIGLCHENEKVTALFASHTELVNGVDYRLTPGGVFEHWSYSEEFTNLSSVQQLAEAKLYSSHFTGPSSFNVRELIMPPRLSQVGDSSLIALTNIKSIAFPGGLSTLGHYTFSGVDRLDRIYIAGVCQVDHERLIRNFSFRGTRVNQLQVFVDSEHVESWRFLEKLKHVRIVPSAPEVRISLDSPIGEIRVQHEGKLTILDANNPSVLLPRFTLCSISYQLPVDYELVEARSFGSVEFPSTRYLVGEMPITLNVREAYCKILEPDAAGATVTFERLDGTRIMPLDSVRRGESVRVRIDPGKYNMPDRVAINGTLLHKTDSVVLLLRDLAVTAQYMPQQTFMYAPSSPQYEWKITPPLLATGRVQLGDVYHIDIALKEGYQLKEFTVNGEPKELPIDLEINDYIQLGAQVEAKRYKLYYDSTTINRLRVEDVLGNSLPSGSTVEYGKNLRIAYAVNLPEYSPKLFMNGKQVHAPAHEPFQHTITSHCNFTMSYDTLWRTVRLSNKARGRIRMSTKKGVVNGSMLSVPYGDSVYIEVLPEHIDRVACIAIEDERYYGQTVRIPVFVDKRIDVVLQSLARVVKFSVHPPQGGTLSLRDSVGHTLRNGGKVAKGTRIAINALPRKGFALTHLYVNQRLADSVPLRYVVHDSTVIEAHFAPAPCVMYDAFCIDTAKRELVYSDSQEALVRIDDPLIERIGSGAFADNAYLERLVIGSSVRRIESGAFARCDNLRFVSMSQSTHHLAEGAFLDCPSLVGIELEHTSPAQLRFADNAFSGSQHEYLFARVPNSSVSRFSKSRYYDLFTIVGEKAEVKLEAQGGNAEPVRVEITSMDEGQTESNIVYTPAELTLKGGALVRIVPLNGVAKVDHNGEEATTPYRFLARMAEHVLLTPTIISVDDKKITSVSESRCRIYPNPTSSIIHIDSPSEGVYAIYSSMGEIVQSGAIYPNGYVVEVGALPQGIYMLRLQWDDALIETHQFIKN